VEPLRREISELLAIFTQRLHSQSPSCEKPFALFKDIWQEQQWDLVHLAVLDARGRQAFIDVVLRVFLGALFSNYPQVPAFQSYHRIHQVGGASFTSGRSFWSSHILFLTALASGFWPLSTAMCSDPRRSVITTLPLRSKWLLTPNPPIRSLRTIDCAFVAAGASNIAPRCAHNRRAYLRKCVTPTPSI
jgi:hypothetical protein